MPLPSSFPIDLSDIQAETNTSALWAAGDVAGKTAGDVAMSEFLGYSLGDHFIDASTNTIASYSSSVQTQSGGLTQYNTWNGPTWRYQVRSNNALSGTSSMTFRFAHKTLGMGLANYSKLEFEWYSGISSYKQIRVGTSNLSYLWGASAPTNVTQVSTTAVQSSAFLSTVLLAGVSSTIKNYTYLYFSLHLDGIHSYDTHPVLNINFLRAIA